MNMMKSVVALVIVAFSATVSAQMVYTPTFATKKANTEQSSVETTNTEHETAMKTEK